MDISEIHREFRVICSMCEAEGTETTRVLFFSWENRYLTPGGLTEALSAFRQSLFFAAEA